MNIVVTGASGGIGGALVEQLAARQNVTHITATWNRNRPALQYQNVTWHQLDLTSEDAVSNWAGKTGDIDWLINAAGILHTRGKGPEKTIRHVDPDFFLQNMNSNTLPSLLLAKHLQERFRHGRPAVFASLSARIGSISDNRLGGWISYRASKAALNMCLKTLSLEWARTLPNVSVAALHPGTTDTALSKPFQRNVPASQLFEPERTAGYLLEVLDSISPDRTGEFLAFDGEQLPW